MKVKETAKKPYGICPASMTIWNADQTYNKKGILGSYALRNNMFDVGAMLLIAVIGYFFLKLEIPIAPIVLALILGPLAESNLRRSLLLSSGQRLHLLHPAHLHLLPAAGGAVSLLAAAAEGAEQPEKGGVRRGVWRTFSAMDL